MPSESKDSKRPLLILGAIVFFLHFLVGGGHLMSPDEELLFRMAESIALRGQTSVLPLEADYATGRLNPALAEFTFATRQAQESGGFYAQYLPLQPMLAAPFIWAGRALDGIASEPFARPVPDGMMTLYFEGLPSDDRAAAIFHRGLLAFLFNPIVAAISAVVLARMGKFLTGSRKAGILMAALWAFGTVAWPHSRTFFTEPLAGLFALLALDQLFRWCFAPRDQLLRPAILIGVFLALANWTRVDSPFFTVGFFSAALLTAAYRHIQRESWGDREQRFPFFELFLIGAIPFGSWLLLQTWNTIRFGASDLTSGYGDQAESVKFTTPLLVGLHGLLFSPGKGMIYFSPALLLGFWGWMRAPRHLRALPWLAALAYFPFTLAMVKWQNWDGGWCWGPRHIIQIHLPIMFGAVFLFAAGFNWKRKLATALIAIPAVLVQIYGSSQNPLEYYREYFTTFEDGEYLRANLVRGPQTASFQQQFQLSVRREDGSLREISPSAFPAPLIDSLYLPQHTQWAKYDDMWRLGYCDWYFWNAIVRGGDTTHWSERL